MSSNAIAMPLFSLDRAGLWSYARGLLKYLPDMVGKHVVHLLQKEATPSLHPSTEVSHANSFIEATSKLIRQSFQGIYHCPVGNRRLFPITGAINIATVHDLAEFHHPRRFGLKHDINLKYILAPLMSKLDHIIAVSGQTKNDLMRWIGIPESKVTVIHNGVDTDTFFPAAQKEKAKVLGEYNLPEDYWIYVSRIEHPVKNHASLLRAYRLLLDRGKSLPGLVFVGPRDFQAQVVYQEIVNLRLESHVHCLGFVPLEHLSPLISGAMASVFPSLFEGFGLPILESMACGTPVLCSDIPVFSEIVSKETARFNPKSPEDIAFHLEDNLVSAPRRVSLPSRFHWKECARQTAQLYSSLLAKRA